MDNKIDVVLVTYNPNIGMVRGCIDSLVLSVRKIWIVDNYSTECSIKDDLGDIYGNVELIQLGENKGIAFAQNIGIQKAIEEGADYILLSDQDTVYPTGFSENMVGVFDNGQFENIAAVAPLFRDVNGTENNNGFTLSSLFSYYQAFPKKGIHKIYFAIASGMIVKASVIKEIGGMDEDLFIDWVDMEWCWRALKGKYLILGNANMIIEHSLGDCKIKIAHKNITVRKPIRHYYITRNAFHLASRCPYIDIWHRLNLMYRGLRYIAVFSLVSKPRVVNLKMTLLGMYHGIVGRQGRLD